jgi:hypothetical protein
MENLWDYLRDNKLSSLVWDGHHAMLNAWNFLANDPDRIVSIGTRSWACVKGQGSWYYTTAVRAPDHTVVATP